MSQTSYSLSMDAGIAGAKVNTAVPDTSLTYNNPVDEIGFGTIVAKVSGDDNGAEKFNSPNSQILGLAILDQNSSYIDEATADDSYPVESAVGVCINGIRYALVDQDVTPDDTDVYVRHSSTLNVQTVTFDIDFVASNSIACSVNGDALTATVYATSHDATLAALAAKIEAHEDVLTATSTGRVITVTSVNSEAITFVITVTLGASQAVDTVVTTVAGVAGLQGYLRKDSDSNKATLLEGVKFLSSASALGLVELKINL